MLNIENVSKRYGKTLANDGVSFAVAGGELAVQLGPNVAHQVRRRAVAL